jgi:hypothetical protein
VSFVSFAGDLDDLLAECETPEMLLACMEPEMFERLWGEPFVVVQLLCDSVARFRAGRSIND